MSTENSTEEISLEPRKIYLKDVSFESPASPDVFTRGQVKPAMDLQLMLHHKKLDDNFHEVVLQITATSKLEEEVLFLVEVHQAGVFEIQCEDAAKLLMVKEIACANMLLPFARETIADLVAKGGFPQLLINPVNFEVLYQQNRRKEKQASKTPASESIN